LRFVLWSLLGVLCTSAGCNLFLTSNKFDKKYLQYQCVYFMECYDEYGYFDFENVSECVEFFEESGYYGGDYYEDCDFNKKAASKCLKGLKVLTKAGCDDYEAAYDKAEDNLDQCSDVYDCSSSTGDTQDTR
jgi:hypothetical protein